MRRVLFFILVFCVLCSTFSLSQNYKQDLVKMNEALKKLDKFHGEIVIRTFEEHNSINPVDEKKASVKIENGNYLSVYDGFIFLSNKSSVLFIDKSEKSITVSVNNQTMNPDSLVRMADSVIFRKKNTDFIQYSVYSSKSVIKRTELFIDTKTMLVKKLIYYYDNKMFSKNNKVIIEFTLLNTAPAFDTGTFSENKFILYKQDKIVPSSNYSDYKVFINN